MGRVVDKKFEKVRKDIGKRTNNLLNFITDHRLELGLPGYKNVKWTAKQNFLYGKLAGLCDNLLEEIDNLDEAEVPDFEK